VRRRSSFSQIAPPLIELRAIVFLAF